MAALAQASATDAQTNRAAPMKKPRLPGSTGASRAAKCDGNERLRKRIVAHSALADPNASHLEVAASVTLKRVKLPSGVQWLNAEQAHFRNAIGT